MNRKILTGLLLSFLAIQAWPQEGSRNILTSATTPGELSHMLLRTEAFTPLPLPGDPAYETIDRETRNEIVAEAEAYLGYDWPSLMAVRYMDFDINGNRSRYASRYYDRRNGIASLVLAEVIENSGRFMDDIVNGIWLVLEETTWVVPAHSGGDKLHDINDVYVDLFSAETAGFLAWIDYFLGDKLDAYTPLIRQRLYDEVDRRVLTSMLDHDDFWYMGYTGRIPNNWNPWIVSNWLTAVLLLEKDPDERVASVYKALDVLDNYLNPHPADGGCDEGPGYWGHAGASLFDCLHLLKAATGGRYDVFDDPLVKNVGNYIYKINISDAWYVNFADGSARINHTPETMYRIGKAIGDQEMMAFAVHQSALQKAAGIRKTDRSPVGLRTIPNLLVSSELSSSDLQFSHRKYHFFPDLEVAVARDSGHQLFYAIKGGFNDESHNHNDAGSFVIFAEGNPLIIDVGVGTYTAKTFSSRRYEIWTMQSAYHNLPTINGKMQAFGQAFRASGFAFSDNNRKAKATVNIEGAYPEEAQVQLWSRSLTLDRRRGTISLQDTYTLEKSTKPLQWHFMLAAQPEVVSEGHVLLSGGAAGYEMTFDPGLDIGVEEVVLDDGRLRKVWGEKVYRLTLSGHEGRVNGEETFVIQKKSL